MVGMAFLRCHVFLFTHGPLGDPQLGSLMKNIKIPYRSMRPHVKRAYNDKQTGALWPQDDLGENLYFPNFAIFGSFGLRDHPVSPKN